MSDLNKGAGEGGQDELLSKQLTGLLGNLMQGMKMEDDPEGKNNTKDNPDA